MSYVYVSYSTRDYTVRTEMLYRLRNAGFEVGMMAHSKKDRLQDASCVLLLLTPYASEDELVRGTIEIAQQLQIPIIGALLGEDLQIAIPTELDGSTPVINLTDDYEAGFSELVQVLSQYIEPKPMLDEALEGYHIFLSHSTGDAEFVDPLAEFLRNQGCTVWKAPDSILPGEEWVAAIERGLSTATHLILVLSPAAIESKWVELEMNTAIRMEREGKLTIIPLDYMSCDAPLLWGSYQAVNFRTDYEAGLQALMRLLT